MRSVKLKAGCALGLLGLVALGGVYLSGWLTLKLLGVSAPLKLLTYYEYVKALDLPQVAQYVKKIKLAGAIGFGVPLLGWLLLLIPLFRSREGAFHGDARFATKADLAKAGLLTRKPEEGIVLGKFGRHYLWLNGAQHVIVVAPTRSGKSTSIAIPVALTYEGSMVVLDVKGELHALTSGYRSQQLGQEIHVWSPYDEGGRTHRFNPFTALLPLDSRLRLGELQTIAAILYPDEAGKDPFWTNQARSAFVAFASFLFENWDHQLQLGTQLDPNACDLFPSFERIYRLTSSEGVEGGVKTMVEGWLKDPSRFAFVSAQTRTGFASLVGLAEETLSSVIASVQAPLQQFLSPILAAATNSTDFDVTQVRRRKMTIYVVIPPKKLDEAGKLLNIFFSTVIGGNLQGDKTTDPGIRHQVLTLMDEFTSMGRLDVWAKRISVSASYGVRDLTIVQSRPQLRSVYGAEDAQNFITNHGASIVFTPREQEDAEAYSKALGDRTVRRQNRSISRGAGGSSVSTSYSEERRPLMLPQEIKEFPKDEELIFVEGCPSIRCKKNWYFKDKLFQQRLLPKVEIPVTGSASIAPAPMHAAPASVAMTTPVRTVSGSAASSVSEARPGPPFVGMVENGKVLSALPILAELQTGRGQNPPTEAGTSIVVHKLSMADRPYELQLKKALEVANARTLRELGPLPPGGLPVQKKEKVDTPYYITFDGRMQRKDQMPVPSEELSEGSDEMKWNQVAATAVCAAGTLSACAQTPLQQEVQHNSKEFSGEWSVEWCDKNNPEADCGGFNVYLVQEGDQVCGNYSGARIGLAEIDERVGRTIFGIVSGGEAELTIESSRNNSAYLVRASVQDEVMTWHVIKTIKEGNGDADLIAYNGRLRRTKAPSEEHDEMRWSQVVATASLAAGTLSACAQPTPEPKKNPHPTQRYEIVMTIQDAPGPFSSIEGAAQYDTVNYNECGVRNESSGMFHDLTANVPITFSKVSDSHCTRIAISAPAPCRHWAPSSVIAVCRSTASPAR